MASTFTLPNSDPPTDVHLTSDITRDQLLSFPAFQRWASTLQRSLSLQGQKRDHPFHDTPYRLRSIRIQAIDVFGGKRIGFIKLTADVSNDKGEKLPGAVFLRGGSVGMMIILQPDDVPTDSEEGKHVILTVQPRVPAGSLALTELPAGMVDDSGTFAGAAAKEIQEEIGLEIPQEELIDLTAKALPDTQKDSGEDLPLGVFPSPGGCDEYVPIFLHQRQVPRGQLKDWQGKLTGLRDHGEKITLRLVPLEDLWRVGGRDAKALAAWSFYEGLRRNRGLSKR